MAEAIRIGIAGAGWPGSAHAKGYQEAGGFKVVAVADLIPQRRKQMMSDFGAEREYADALELVADKEIDAISVCLPNHLHAPIVIAAAKAKKHVICESPPALTAREARQMEVAAQRAGKVLLFGLQRRFGSHAQAARQAIDKGFAGEVYHARAVWTRTRGVPLGTGWFTQKDKSGGGALMDVGLPILDVAWYLLGQPKAVAAFGVTHRRFRDLVSADAKHDVDDAAFAIVRFEGGKSIELASTWAINQPEHQNGTVCRMYGEKGAVEVYTDAGAILYRGFGERGESKQHPLKGPKTVNYPALMKHFRECILGKAQPLAGGAQGVALMEMVEAIYKSAETAKSVVI